MSTTNLILNQLPRFPAHVSATNGLVAVVENGVDLVIVPDFGSLVPVPAVTNPSLTYFMAWDSSIDYYQSISFTDLANNLAGQVLAGTLLALKNVTFAADQGVYFSDANTAHAYSLSSFVRGISGSADAAAFRTGIGIGTGSNGQVLSVVAGVPSWVNLAMPGHLYGLTLSNNATDAVNDIDIAAGSAASDAATPVMMTLAAGITKRLDAAWAVGTGNGGLDTGSIANTTYHMWLIQRSDTGVVDVLFSASATAPTMPTNYDRKRYIMPILRVGGAIRPFIQHEDTIWWNDPTTGGYLDVNVTNPGTANVTRTLASVPIGIAVDAILNLGVNNNSASPSVTTASELALPAIAAGSTAAHGLWNTTSGSGSAIVVRGPVRTNTSGQIRTNTNTSGASISLQIGVLGFTYTRGRV